MGVVLALSKRDKRAHALMHNRKLSFLPNLPREPALARARAGGTACEVVFCRPNQGMLFKLCGARVLLRNCGHNVTRSPALHREKRAGHLLEHRRPGRRHRLGRGSRRQSKQEAPRVMLVSHI